MRRSLSLSLSFLAVVGVGVGIGVVDACTVSEPCGCFACSSAISLFVIDEAGQPINDGWEVEASLDGQPVDTSACEVGVRPGNQCAFGFDSGVYEVVVRTPSEEKHVSARAAARGGLDCCTGACLPTENVPVVLGATTP
jgi:hypothetical protein